MERLTTRNDMGIAVLKQPYRCERCGEETWSLSDHGNGEPIDKLAEYEDMEENGKLIRLPVAVGDKLYEPRPDEGTITEYAVNYIGYYGKDYEYFIGWRLLSGIYSDLSGIHAGQIGKTVFCTREEAEAAIKRVDRDLVEVGNERNIIPGQTD